MGLQKQFRSGKPKRAVFAALCSLGLSASLAQGQVPELPPLPELPPAPGTTNTLPALPALPALNLPSCGPAATCAQPSLPRLTLPGSMTIATPSFAQAFGPDIKVHCVRLVGLKRVPSNAPKFHLDHQEPATENLPEVVAGMGSASGTSWNGLPSVPGSGLAQNVKSTEPTHGNTTAVQSVSFNQTGSGDEESLFDVHLPTSSPVVHAVVVPATAPNLRSGVRTAHEPVLANSSARPAPSGGFHLSDSDESVDSKSQPVLPPTRTPIEPPPSPQISRATNFLVDPARALVTPAGIASSSSSKKGSLKVGETLPSLEQPKLALDASKVSLPTTPSAPTAPVPAVQPASSTVVQVALPTPTVLEPSTNAQARSTVPAAPASTSQPSPTVTGPASPHEQLQASIATSFPKSKITIRQEEEGLVVEGLAASETEAKKVLALVRKSTLTPVTDRVSVKR